MVASESQQGRVSGYVESLSRDRDRFVALEFCAADILIKTNAERKITFAAGYPARSGTDRFLRTVWLPTNYPVRLPLSDIALGDRFDLSYLYRDLFGCGNLSGNRCGTHLVR
jgi:hypothetical protein